MWPRQMRISWGRAGLVVLMLGILALSLWVLPHQARGESPLPTAAPTLVPVTMEPLRRPGENVAPEPATLQALLEEKLYRQAWPFLKRMKGKWLHITIDIKRENIYAGKSLLPPESRMDIWMQVGEDGRVVQIFSIEKDKSGGIVQMNLSKGMEGAWNSISGYHKWRFNDFPDSPAYWLQLEAKRFGFKGPFFWTQKGGMLQVVYRTRQEPPTKPAQSTLAHPITEVAYQWEYSLKSGLLQRHKLNLTLSDGTRITERQEAYQYQITNILPIEVQPLFEYAERQFLHMYRK